MKWWVKALLLSIGWVVLVVILGMFGAALMATINPQIEPEEAGRVAYNLSRPLWVVGIILIWVIIYQRRTKA